MADAPKTKEDLPTPPSLRSVTPDLPRHVLSKLSAFIEIRRADGRDALAASLRRLHDLWHDEVWSLELRAVALVLADLIDQGWDVVADDIAIQLKPPGLRLVGETPEQAKERLRQALMVGRNRQLSDAGVQRFLKRMHRIVPRHGGRSSIADVIDDGVELARLLERCADASDRAATRLKSVIDPVVEICDEDTKCRVTGLRLIDIWRYFRHTWSLEYRPIPGRQLALLVRNAARPKRPVMGIAMLASPVVRMRVRDDWIGWNPEPYLAKLRNGEWDCEIALRALVARLERSLSEIRSDDLVSPDELAFPAERTILRLEQRNAGAAFSRQRELEAAYAEAEEANEPVRSQRDDAKYMGADADWRGASEDSLFVRKRADTLGRLLGAKRALQSLDWTAGGRNLLDSLLRHPNGLRTLSVILAEVRKAGLSSQIVDVSVCGAVPPYNVLLGGKLVALLVTSQEVRDAYRERYGQQVSVISSQMAGRPIYRPAELKLLTTTSLYGNGSSQYNRLRLRASMYPELSHDIEWLELAQTAGYGTVHLDATTVRVLREVSQRMHGARRVNNRFGEGASPRLRQIREAVEALGIDASSVLNHATPRIFYCCELHPLARQELLGFYPTTESKGPSSATVASVWRQRWLSMRVRNPEVLGRVAAASAQTLAEFLEGASRAVPAAAGIDDVGELFKHNEAIGDQSGLAQ